MKRFLATTALVLSLAFFVQAPQVFADPSGTADGSSCTLSSGGSGLLQSGICVASSAYVSQSNPTTSTNPATAAGGAAASTPTNSAPNTDAGYNSVMIHIMQLFAWLVGVAALVLDYAMYYTVINMGSYISHLTAVGVAWRILRDLGNIAIIFGFLYVGIATIVDVNWYGSREKLLPALILSAVFLNFSLFAAEAVIDVGNLFATEFFTQINGGVTPTATTSGLLTVGGSTLTTANEGISNKIMSQLGLQVIYGQAQTANTAIFQGGNPWLIGFMGILLFIVTAFVMFSLAFILIARFIILLILIILAPIGVAGFAIPPLESSAKKWRDTLIHQTITAPVLLLLLYVALAVITDAQFLTGFGNGSASAVTGFIGNANLPGFAGFILSFLVAMGLLLLVTVQAKSLSAFGAGWATKTAGKVTGGFIGYGIAGTASLAARSTLGLGGRLLNNKRMQAAAAGGGFKGFAAKVGAFTGRNLENRKFDLRNVKTLSAVGGALTGLAATTVGNSGFESVASGTGKGATVSAKQAFDKTKEVYSTYKPFQGEWWRDQKKEYEKAKAEQDQDKVLAQPGTSDFAKTLNKMSEDELSELKGIRQGLSEFVTALSPTKYAALAKSPKLLAQEKKNLNATWDNQFNVATPNGGGAPVNNAKATIGRMATEDIAALSPTTLAKSNVVEVLSSTEFEAIRKKGTLTRDQRQKIFDQMINSKDPALMAEVQKYFDPANDQGGNRAKYWNVNNVALPGVTPTPTPKPAAPGVIIVPTNVGRGPRPKTP